jgi:prepilin-type N-terminal cleavage/methylation domain-containing protein
LGYFKESTIIRIFDLIMITGLQNRIQRSSNICGMRTGFSLAEVLAAVTIGSMILVAVLSIYNRADKSAAKVTQKLQSTQLSSEVLQRIAEDLDRIISSDQDTTINIQNKFKNGFPAAKLTITKTIKDSANKEQTFEEILWQSLYDYESPDTGLVLYRGYSGIALEDKLLDKNKDDLELNRSAPICSGVTFFEINAIQDGKPVNKWDGRPPSGITVTLSFAEPYKKVNGTLDVPDTDKDTRTIAIDRTRKILFALETEKSPEDANTPKPADTTGEEKSPLRDRLTTKTGR